MFARLIYQHDLTRSEVGDHLGVSQSYVSDRLAFLKLSPDVQRDVMTGQLTLTRALNGYRKAHGPRDLRPRAGEPGKVAASVYVVVALEGFQQPPYKVIVATGRIRRPGRKSSVDHATSTSYR
jgi:hypothetical protein